MSQQLLEAIGLSDLEGYFEELDAIRESGAFNMFGAARVLADLYTGMSMQEARVVLAAWQKTFSHTLPASDRAINALEQAA